MQSPIPRPGTPRGDRVLAAAAAVLLLVAAAWLSHAAPCGTWSNRIFGTQAWGEADPGAWYLYAAHELGARAADDDAPPIYHGHPGTPLLLLLRGIQHAHVALAGPDATTAAARDRFLAQHLSEVFWLSKVGVTGLHLLSFLALFVLARDVLRDPHAAFLGVLAYATCLPVLYYVSRISPEPLMVACFAGALAAFWRYEGHAVAGRRAPAAACLTAAGVLAATGAVAKLQLAAPLPPLLVAMALTDFPRRLSAPALPWRARLAAAALVSIAAGVALAIYSRWIDWSTFFAYWSRLPAVRAAPFGDAAARGELMPGISAANLFPTAEGAYLLLGVLGAVWLLRRSPDLRPRALAVLAFGAFGALMFAYRVSLSGSFLPFHYAFGLLAAATPFVGGVLGAVERRVWPWRGSAGAAGFALVAVLALHGLSIAAAVGSRLHDARVFAPNRAAWSLIARLEPDEVLLVEDLSRPGHALSRDALHSRLARLQAWPARNLLGIGGPRPALAVAFDSLFATLPAGRPAPDLPRVPAPLADLDLVRVPRDR